MPQTGADTLLIEKLGHRGDGIAHAAGGAVHVPYTLAGERVEVDGGGARAMPLRIVTPSPDRIAPFCPHFGTCGGCAIQHMATGPYLDWKRSLVVDALSHAGVEAQVDPVRDGHGAGRRRITLHARLDRDILRVGFAAARSHSIVPIDRCPITVPALKGAIPAAWKIAEALKPRKKPLDIAVTATASGLDVDVRGAGPVEGRLRLELGALAEACDLARLSIHGDVILERRTPTVRFGTVSVSPPPGGFLQATEAGERELARLVADGVGEARRIADLFAGCGTFALRLAAGAHVHAVEHDRPALAALDRAARQARGLKPVTVEARDLFRRPLMPAELAAYDAVVADPPRAGAEAQARQIAASTVATVVMVSCAPSTLARDLAILLSGGYRIERVVPVDQFRHSAHVETVTVLKRR